MVVEGTGVRSHLRQFKDWAISFTPLCLCLSEETVTPVGPFYLVSARGSKRSNAGKWKKPMMDSLALEKDTLKTRRTTLEISVVWCALMCYHQYYWIPKINNNQQQHNTLNTVLVMLIFSKHFMSCMTFYFYSKLMQWNLCIFSYKQKSSKVIREQPIYMVFEDLLMQLFQLCGEYGHPTQGFIMQKCRKCGCLKTWTSHPYTRRLPAGFILISCAILLSSALPSRVLKVLSFNNLLSISPSTFRCHQKGYIASCVMAEWLDAKAQIMDEIGGGLELSRDARFNSPGHCVKYGCYSLLEN